MKHIHDDYLLLHEFYKSARANLEDGPWDYLRGAAESETTFKRNRAALDAIAFRPRVLRDVEDVDVSASLIGETMRIPVITAPIGSLQDFDPDGGAAVARACTRFGTMQMQSSVSAPGMEATAAASDGPKLFQLYVRGDEKWVDDQARRAIDAGYKGFCLTVDLDYYAKRERDVGKRYVTTARRTDGRNEHHQKRFNWADVDRLKATIDVPLMIKGIATAEDARLCVEHGVDVVYVSNHGGRQLDQGRGSIDVLPEVVDAVRGKAQVMIDGGFMRGTDVVKAMALGANAVAMGRMYGFALAANGEDGVVRMLEILEQEIQSCLGLLGVRNFAELDSSYLYPGAPLMAPAGYDSIFPLMQEGY
ncbi:MAG: isopentenyl diphosphate isomerase/L-lactate dehydrogenase-like FMN-dependent dehydrogenase [Gammaproteobacteria bacterium]|jgi:isopentenyl diphosphate isomerase/L-lactate dehydrogenase-like FMN-dependent dehydrogenase